MLVGIGNHRIFTENEQTANFLVDCSLEHIGGMKPRLAAQFNPPGLFKLIHHRIIGNFLVTRHITRHCPHITGTLYIVLSAQRIHAASRTAQFTDHHGHVGHGHNTLGTG